MMYRPNFYESTCLRCNEIVYQVDRVGPLKDFTFFHSGCFKCVTCGTKLTLKTYYNNQHKQEDKEVSCQLVLSSFTDSQSTFRHIDCVVHLKKLYLMQSNNNVNFNRFIAVHMYQKVVPATLIKTLSVFVKH